jgi:cell division protein FtsL
MTMQNVLEQPRIRVDRLADVYRASPFRIQRQWVAVVLLVMVAFAMISGLYLNVTARAALYGREIQTLEAEIIATERVNADLQTQLGNLMSIETLEQRARAMGFEPVTQDQLQYMVISGYFPPEPVTLVSTPPSVAAGVAPEYSQSLFDWFDQQIQSASSPLGNVLP